MNRRQKIIVSVTGIFLVLLILVGLTYAYFLTRINGNTNSTSISVTTADLELTYEDGEAVLSTTGLIEPGFTATKEFRVRNTGNAPTSYSIKIDNVNSDFIRDEDWTYELYMVGSDNSEQLITQGFLPMYDFYLDGSTNIDVNDLHSYKLKIKYENLNVDQSIDMGASLSFRVNIDNETSLETVEMTKQEFLNLNENGTITLNSNVILTDYLTIDGSSTVSTLDLNDHILTVKGEKEPYDTAYPHIKISKNFEIKNGVIRRHEATSASDYSAQRGAIVYALNSDANLTISDTVLDGENINLLTQDGARGAAIYVANISSLTINSSIIRNNLRESGVWMGAIYSEGTDSVTVNDSKIINNSAPRGAALHVVDSSEVKIINSHFNNNFADSIGIVAVQNVDSFIFDETSIIKNNQAGEASGLRIADVNNAVISGTIENNETTLSDGNGGGLYLHLSENSNVATIESTAKIINNIAGGAGGGIYVNSKADSETTEVGNAIMNGGLVSGNIAKGTPATGTLKDGGGAGIYVARGKMTINGGTIENNVSTSGIGNAIIVSNAGKKANGGILQINGGTILGSIKVAETYGTLTINGGTYSFDVSNYLGSGKSVTQTNGQYIVE